MKTSLAAALALTTALIAAPALAQAPEAAAPAAPAAPRAPPPPMTITKVKPNLYFIVGGGGNSELLTTKSGALLVDTKNLNDKDYGDLMMLIGSVTDKKVRVVIDTHHHADHTGNNEKFLAAGAKVVGQETLPKILEHYTTRLAPHTPLAPTTLYRRRLPVRIYHSRVQLYHFGPGHTGADTLVYFPQQRAIAFGDLLVEDPTVPNYDAGNGGGSLLGFQRSLGEALKLRWDVAFPGHGGKPLTKAEVRAYKGKIDQLIARIQAAIDAGTPKDKLIESLKTEELGWKIGGQFWAPPERVEALYAELAAKK